MALCAGAGWGGEAWGGVEDHRVMNFPVWKHNLFKLPPTLGDILSHPDGCPVCYGSSAFHMDGWRQVRNSKGNSCKICSPVLVPPSEKHKQVLVPSWTSPLHSKHLNISPTVPRCFGFSTPTSLFYTPCFASIFLKCGTKTGVPSHRCNCMTQSTGVCHFQNFQSALPN